MTKFKISSVLSLIIAFTITQVYVKAQVPIAVVDLEGKGVSNTEASTLSDRLRDELFKTGQFQVMERGMMDQILKEQEFQLTGCTSNECLVEIGQLISVQQIVGGSIGKVGNVFSISARVISVETGEIITVSTYDYMGDIGGLLTQGMRNVAVQLATGKALKSLPIMGKGKGGTFYITSEPSGASVWIDDIAINGNTPLLVEDQNVGEHKINIQKEDYSAETIVQLKADDMKKVDLVLKLGLGSLKVITTPFEASVYLDDKYKGLSPLILKDIVAGVHSLKVGKGYYTSAEKSIEIKSNTTEEIHITLLKLLTVSDIDGNTYHTVSIGNQVWMVENLRVTHYRNGDAISDQWSYSNNESNVATYGRLYSWYAVNDSRNIAPEGWRVPSDAEWKELEMYLGMSQSEADDTGWRGTDEGGKLKESGTEHWNSPNADATNESGFSALPGGSRHRYRYYLNMGIYATFWSSTVSSGSLAWRRCLNHNFSEVYRNDFNKRYGFSVRCIRD